MNVDFQKIRQDDRPCSAASRLGGTSQLARHTFAFVLAGGRGTRLGQLTDWRAKPAMPFAGKLRLIDFPLSNCVNSGIRRIAVLTQYKAQSLIRHIERGWGFLAGNLSEFVDVVPAQQQVGQGWYSGTADAVYQNLNIVRDVNPELVLILAGDHVYKMDDNPFAGRCACVAIGRPSHRKRAGCGMKTTFQERGLHADFDF